MKVLRKILKLESLKAFLKTFLVSVLILAVLFVLWMVSVDFSFPTNYESRETVTETSRFIYDDWIDFTAVVRGSQSRYVIELETGTYVLVPTYIYDELLEDDHFEETEKGRVITVEYDTALGYTYRLDNGKEIDVHYLVSLKGKDVEYISREDYIAKTREVKFEYRISFLVVVFLAVVFLFVAFLLPFSDIKRIIVQDKKKRIKRAKRDAYRKRLNEEKEKSDKA